LEEVTFTTLVVLSTMLSLWLNKKELSIRSEELVSQRKGTTFVEPSEATIALGESSYYS
jgi:hypothetical protein